MSLKIKSILLVVTCFLFVFLFSLVLLQFIGRDIREGLGTMYAREQVNFNRARILHPLMREVALARKLAASESVRSWAGNENDPAYRASALGEMAEFRNFFTDKSCFFAIRQSGHYYFMGRNDRTVRPTLRYTLDPSSPEDLWFFRTLGSGEDYALNVDYDEKLRVTKVWVNVVVRDRGQPVGIIGTGIDLSEFIASVIQSDHSGVTSIFVEKGGAIQAHNQKSRIDFRTISKQPSERKTIFQLAGSKQDEARLREAMDRLAGGAHPVEILTANIDGKVHLVGLGAIREIGWYNVTLLDTSSIINARHIVPFALLLFVALLCLSAALAMMLNRFVIRRIHRLDKQILEFAAGAEITRDPVRPGDEMGRLEQTFQKMAVALREQERILEQRVADRTRELAAANEQLQQALADIKVLSGCLPICTYCKGIRDDKGAWNKLEKYIAEHSDAQFTHGICDKCMEKEFPKLHERKTRKNRNEGVGEDPTRSGKE